LDAHLAGRIRTGVADSQGELDRVAAAVAAGAVGVVDQGDLFGQAQIGHGRPHRGLVVLDRRYPVAVARGAVRIEFVRCAHLGVVRVIRRRQAAYDRRVDRQRHRARRRNRPNRPEASARVVTPAAVVRHVRVTRRQLIHHRHTRRRVRPRIAHAHRKTHRVPGADVPAQIRVRQQHHRLGQRQIRDQLVVQEVVADRIAGAQDDPDLIVEGVPVGIVLAGETGWIALPDDVSAWRKVGETVRAVGQGRRPGDERIGGIDEAVAVGVEEKLQRHIGDAGVVEAERIARRWSRAAVVVDRPGDGPRRGAAVQEVVVGRCGAGQIDEDPVVVGTVGIDDAVIPNRIDFHNHITVRGYIGERIRSIDAGENFRDLHAIAGVAIAVRIGPQLHRDAGQRRIAPEQTILIGVVKHRTGDVRQLGDQSEIGGQVLLVGLHRDRCLPVLPTVFVKAVTVSCRQREFDGVLARIKAGEAVDSHGIHHAVAVHVLRAVTGRLGGDHVAEVVFQRDQHARHAEFVGILNAVVIEIQPDPIPDRRAYRAAEQVVFHLAIVGRAFVRKQGKRRPRGEQAETAQPRLVRHSDRTRRNIEGNRQRLGDAGACNRLADHKLALIDQRIVVVEIDPTHQPRTLARRYHDGHLDGTAAGTIGPRTDVPRHDAVLVIGNA